LRWVGAALAVSAAAGCGGDWSWYERSSEPLPAGAADPLAAVAFLAIQGVWIVAEATGEWVVDVWREARDRRVPGAAWDSAEGQRLRLGQDH
jgi:hypothetical protein